MLAFLFGLKSISPATLNAERGRAGLHVYDVNAAQRWSQARVPGAIHLDHERFSADQLPPDREATLVFYCSNPMCRKAPYAARRAKALGYTNTRVMSAGIQGWIAAGLATEGAKTSGL